METEYKHHTEEINKATDFFQTLLNKYNQEKIISLSQKEEITELYKQLEDKYSTETHILVKREVLQDLNMELDGLADGFRQLDNTFDDITSYANDIANDSEYNDANSWRGTARDCMSKIEDILDPMPEEQETEEVE